MQKMKVQGKKSVWFFCLLLSLGMFFCLNGLKVKAAETGEAPKVVKAQMINDRDMELYWDQEVTGAGDKENFSITVDGRKNEIYSYTWEEYNYTENGIVYYNPKSSEKPDGSDTPKTSIRLTDAISDVENLPEIKVTIAGNKIKNASGTYAAAQTVTVDTYEPFYQQEIVLDCGVKILGSKNVKAEAMTKAEEMLKVILANENVAKQMGDTGCMLGIYGEGEIAYDIPEHRFEYDPAYLYVEGFGGTQLASIKDANVLRLTTGNYTTVYTDECILAHEFAHTVKNFGLTEAQQTELENVYASSVTRGGKWANSYAGSNSDEYFATLTAIWFNAMNDTADGQWDGVRGPINTRDELKAYDKDAYDFLSTIYVSNQYLPSPWENGSVPNNYVYEGTGDNGNDEDTDTAAYQRIASKASSSEYDTCIEVYGGEQAEGAKIDVWYDFDDNAFLGWLFEKTPDNYYKIKFYNSNLVLMPKNASKTNGEALTLGKDTGADAQLWQLKKTSGDYMLIINKNSKLALTIQGNAAADGNLLIQSSYSGSGRDSQQWKVYDASTKAVFTPESVKEPEPNPVEKKYTVKFVYNNGKKTITKSVREGQKVSEPAKPTRRNYLFKGWYLGKKPYSFSSKVTGNLTLQAKWTKVTVKKTSISSLKAQKGKKAALKIKNVSGAKGYRITYARDAKFKKAVKKKYVTSNKLTVKNLKKGTYYFKVSAYKLDSTGQKVFGKVSKVKKITVK